MDLKIAKDRLYVHKKLTLTYTTYDMSRATDSIKPFLSITSDGISPANSSHCYIMLRQQDSEKGKLSDHFSYAQVLGVFHVNARLQSTDQADHSRMDVLWVRWFACDLEAPAGGVTNRRLDRIKFVPMGTEDSCFGLVDPGDVIRASHIIPGFNGGGVSTDNLGGSFAQDPEGDFRYYWVNRCVHSRTSRIRD